MKIEIKMCDLPRIWDDFDGFGSEYREKYFTIGKGKSQYCLWTCGNSGLHYCYQVDKDGYASKKRAVEPTATVYLHIIEK